MGRFHIKVPMELIRTNELLPSNENMHWFVMNILETYVHGSLTFIELLIIHLADSNRRPGFVPVIEEIALCSIRGAPGDLQGSIEFCYRCSFYYLQRRFHAIDAVIIIIYTIARDYSEAHFLSAADELE